MTAAPHSSQRLHSARHQALLAVDEFSVQNSKTDKS